MKYYDTAPEGFISSYVIYRNNELLYPHTREDYIDMGFVPAGEKAELYEFHGYDYDIKKLQNLNMQIGMVFTVKTCEIGRSSSTYTFEEVEGSFNSVSFRSVNWIEKESSKPIILSSTIKYDPIEDQYYLVCPELKKTGFNSNDVLNWVECEDGTFLLTKMN